MHLINEVFNNISIAVERPRCVSLHQTNDVGAKPGEFLRGNEAKVNNEEAHILHLNKIGPAVVVITKADRPCGTSNVVALNAIAIKVAPVRANVR